MYEGGYTPCLYTEDVPSNRPTTIALTGVNTDANAGPVFVIKKGFPAYVGVHVLPKSSDI